MNLLFQSDEVFLFDYRSTFEQCPDELWQLFRKATVEASQASSLNFSSFADECLLCARIVAKQPPPPHYTIEVDQSLQAVRSSEAPTDWLSPLPSITPPQGPPYARFRTDGFIYLHAGPANFPSGEVNIGVIMNDGMQRHGYAREAVQLVLSWAFEVLQFHRVQASILDTPFKDRALRLFIGSGFTYEGTKRRAIYHAEGDSKTGIWKDVAHLAMLDTEWVLRSTRRRDRPVQERPVSVWDEMFARHSKEREALVQWEENHGRMSRTLSMETVRKGAGSAALAQDLAYLTDNASSSGEPSVSGSAPPSPPPNVVVTWESDAQMEDEDIDATDEVNQRWEDVVEMSYAMRQNRERINGTTLTPSPPSRLLALPSIPSTRTSFEENVQSPLTIPSLSGSPPPSPPSTLSVPSPALSSWSDSEDETNLLVPPTHRDFAWVVDSPSPLQYPLSLTRWPSPVMSRSRSSSTSSSSDSWSDAQSSADAWDLISNTSNRGRHGGEQTDLDDPFRDARRVGIP